MKVELSAVTSIRGIVTPIAWDSRDQVTEVSITAIDGREYCVIPDAVGAKLLAYIRQGVAASGRSNTVRGVGQRCPFKVENFEVLGPIVDWDEEAT